MLIGLAVAGVGAFAGAGAAVVADPVVASRPDGAGASVQPAAGAAVSADGRRVAFTSAEVLAGTPVSGTQLYVRDLATGRTLLASSTAAGAGAAGGVDDPAGARAYALSGDGRYAVFASAAGNLEPGPSDGGAFDVFRKDLATGELVTVSRLPGGDAVPAPVGGDPDISFDGARVVYTTGGAVGLWSGDANPQQDVVLRDLRAGTTLLVSAGGDGTPLAGAIGRPAISADGRVVAFEDDGAVMVRDVAAGTTTPSGAGSHPDLSGDGGVVAYRSGTAILRRDVASGAGGPVAADGADPAISADGARVVFTTGAALAAGDVDGVADVYAADAGGTVQRVSQRRDGSAGSPPRPSARPAASGAGDIVAFTLDDGVPSGSPAAGDDDGVADVLVARLDPTDAAGPAVATVAPAAGALTTSATATVQVTATDPSGVGLVSIGGVPADRGPGGLFAAPVPLVVGDNTVAVEAADGAGNVAAVTLLVRRVTPAPALRKARATGLRLTRQGRTLVANFVLGPNAVGVAVRVWRRVLRPGAAPGWTPVAPGRRVVTTAGRRRVLVRRSPLPPGVYQVRITVVSRGGVAVTSGRIIVPRTRSGR